jgi:YVTN family beta-propeller protein
VLPLRWCLVAGSALALSCGSSSQSAGDPPDAAPAPTLYVTVYGTDEIVVIDATSRAVVDHIPLGSGKGPAILLKTPDGKKLYAANWKDNSLSAIDVATHTVTPIALDSRPWVEAMSPMGDNVYVGLNSNKIGVISTASDTMTATVDTGGLLPESIIVSPDGSLLYVAAIDQSNPVNFLSPGSVEAIWAWTGTVVHAPLKVGVAPAWITIAPDGSKVYALNFLGGSVSVIDEASWTVSDTVSLSSGGDPIIGASTATSLLVTNFGAASVSVVDTTSNKVTHTLTTKGRPVGVDVSADGSRAYVTVFGPDSLSKSPDPTVLETGDLSSAIGTQPGTVVVVDPATGLAVGDPISVGGAGPTSVVVE